MSIGPFQNLPGSHEMHDADALANEPWLLPVSDETSSTRATTDEELRLSVRKASRPFWMAANVLGVAMALVLALQATTGFMSPAPHHAVGPVADAIEPTIPVQKAAFTGEH